MIREQFINATLVKNYTNVEQNLDDKTINVCIFKAQELHIMEILGSNFYNHLMTKIQDDNLNSDEEELIDGYIKFSLLEWTKYELAFEIHSKITNKGITNDIAQYVVTADRQQFNTKVNKIQNDAVFYDNRLINYLKLNCNLFPEYKVFDSEQNLNVEPNTLTNGFYIPKRKIKKYRF